VGNYNVAVHNAYNGLHYGWLNREFELAGVLCHPHLEPIVRKRKAATSVPPPQKIGKKWRHASEKLEPIARKRKAATSVPPPQKIGKKWRHARGSSSSGDPTSAQELALAKALKLRQKFSSGSSRLNLTEKASVANVGIHRGMKALPRTGVVVQI
jgi:hypothetical protein